MNWTEPSNPKEGVSYYTHVISETPLGQCLIEWKRCDSYSVTIGNKYVGEGHELDESKLLAKYFLVRKRDELSLLLSQ